MVSKIPDNIIKIKTSRLGNSTGGGVGKTLDYSVVFNFDEEESFFSVKKYKFFYIVNSIDADYVIYKIKLSLSLIYSSLEEGLSVEDRFNISFGNNINFFIFDTSIFRKNLSHLTYTETGEILEYRKSISEFIISSGRELTYNTSLAFSEYLPFGVCVETLGPLERIFGIPLKINVKVYAK
ncbi:MAG: hypothetical protein QXP88_00180 [Thermoproteota archaeon]